MKKYATSNPENGISIDTIPKMGYSKDAEQSDIISGGIPMYRAPTNARIDQRVFSKTAKKTKQINISPKNMRGGIRL